MGLDVKEKALLSFVAKVTLPLVAVLGPLVAYTGIWEHPLWFLGLMTAGVYTAKFLSYVAERVTRRRKDLVGKYGKWAVVTGATSGIGEAFAHELAGRGMNVLIISRTQAKLEKTKADILRRAPEGVEVEVLAYDFTRMAEADAFYARLGQVAVALQKKGGIGMLVNNVGTNVEIPEFLHELPESEILNIVRVNVEGTVRMTRAILPFMAERYVFDLVSYFLVFCACLSAWLRDLDGCLWYWGILQLASGSPMKAATPHGSITFSLVTNTRLFPPRRHLLSSQGRAASSPPSPLCAGRNLICLSPRPHFSPLPTHTAERVPLSTCRRAPGTTPRLSSPPTLPPRPLSMSSPAPFTTRPSTWVSTSCSSPPTTSPPLACTTSRPASSIARRSAWSKIRWPCWDGTTWPTLTSRTPSWAP